MYACMAARQARPETVVRLRSEGTEVLLRERRHPSVPVLITIVEVCVKRQCPRLPSHPVVVKAPLRVIEEKTDSEQRFHDH